MKWRISYCVIGLVLLSCGDSNSVWVEDSEKIDMELDSTQQTKIDHTQELDSLAHSEVPFLDIIFIESLESGWDGSYQKSRLAKRGYVLNSTQKLGDRTVLIFENATFGKKLFLGKFTYPDGETEFVVDYRLKNEQLIQFKRHLDGTSYEPLTDALFWKRGMGTYDEKSCSITQNGFSIIYSHTVGKELSLGISEFAEDELF